MTSITEIQQLARKPKRAEPEPVETNKENEPLNKTKKVKANMPKSDLPLQEFHFVPNFEGWKLTTKTRVSGNQFNIILNLMMIGQTTGRLDFYYVSPSGKQFRSLVEVKRNLEDSEIAEDLIDEFKKLQAQVRKSYQIN